MNIRLVLYEWSARHRLSAAQAELLARLFGLMDPPPGAAHQVARGFAFIAAALSGFGVILWVAANWDVLERIGRFALLEGAVLTTALVAWRQPRWRIPLSTLSWLMTGALLAYTGQTYQTGADTWQLFVLWSAVTLPLCLGTRNDWLWTGWTVVAATGVVRWLITHAGDWLLETPPVSVFLIAWLATLALCTLLHPRWRPATGAGVKAWRLALAFAVLLVTALALRGLLIDSQWFFFPAGLLTLTVAAVLFARKVSVDVFALSLCALALDMLIAAKLGSWLIDASENWWNALLLWGLVNMGLLTGTVQLIRHFSGRATPSTGEGA